MSGKPDQQQLPDENDPLATTHRVQRSLDSQDTDGEFASPVWIISVDGQISSQAAPGIPEDLSPEFRPGTLVHERYLLRKPLGRGGMGHVLLAFDRLLKRMVAMKVVSVRAAHSQTAFQEALEKEARLCASLNDANIAAVYDFGIHAGRSYTIFEYVEGETLRERLNRLGQLSLPEIRTIVACLARALDYAHSKGIVHRDLKPENICLTRQGHPKILDFGIARDLRTDFRAESFCGTPHYAAPEQARCSAADGRTDQYALGILTWEMLTGRRPFEAESSQEILRMQREAPVPMLESILPGLPTRLADSIRRALQKNPADRFATCREFAESLSSEQDREPSPEFHSEPDRSGVASSSSADCLLYSAAEDSRIAAELAESLHAIGISTWLLQRDANPNSTLRTQLEHILRQAHIVVPLLSHAAIYSDDFAEFMTEAGAYNHPFVGLLVNMSLEEFEQLRPRWRSVLGASQISVLDVPSYRTNAESVARILQSVVPNAAPRVPSHDPVQQPQYASHAWATDASQIEIRDLNRVVFRTSRVNDFLTLKNRFFLVGTKGQGKSLLLSFKRHLLTQTPESVADEHGICFIPQGRPFLDFMSELKSLSSRLEQPLSELTTCKRFWLMALRVSVVSHHPDVVSDLEVKEEVNHFPPRFRRWLQGEPVAPSVVFKELTNQTFSQANSLLDDSETWLDQKLRSIHNGVCIFVDKVDQAVRQLRREAWVAIQAGLIEAAWELMNSNSHIKVFASIREEAFVNYQSDVKANLLGAATVLDYSSKELEALMDQLCGCYESRSGFKEFLGIQVVKHPHRPVPEDSFRFVRRHTFGRPRDLVVIAAELSAQRNQLSEAAFCEIVRRTSSQQLVGGIFEEMRVFMDCLHDLPTRNRFLQSLNTNVFSRTDAVAVCARFNNVSPETIIELGDDAKELFHPFQDLYFAGLLGVVEQVEDSDRQIQSFRESDSLMNADGTELPHSPFYVLHPALSGYVRAIRRAGEFRAMEHFSVGHRLPWERWFGILYGIELAMKPLRDVSLRRSIHQLIRIACEELRSGTPGSLPIILNATLEWRQTIEHLTRLHFDDLALWLEELRTHQSN